MRIIAGEFKSRKILPPAGDVTRPITDRVKQSLFDILSPRIEGANVYDCFAGTGSMGLECLSRGAAHATFFDSDRSAVALLKKNIAALGVQNRSTVISTDLFKWFQPPLSAPPPPKKADLLFLDPPYRFLGERPRELQQLADQITTAHLAPAALLIFRHNAADSLQLPGFQSTDNRTYGGMTVEILRLKRVE